MLSQPKQPCPKSLGTSEGFSCPQDGKFVLRSPRQIPLFACSPFAITGAAKERVPAALPHPLLARRPATSQHCFFSCEKEKDRVKRQLGVDRGCPWVITLACRQEPPLPGEGEREGRTLSLSSLWAPFIWEEVMDHSIALSRAGVEGQRKTPKHAASPA